MVTHSHACARAVSLGLDRRSAPSGGRNALFTLVVRFFGKGAPTPSHPPKALREALARRGAPRQRCALRALAPAQGIRPGSPESRFEVTWRSPGAHAGDRSVPVGGPRSPGGRLAVVCALPQRCSSGLGPAQRVSARAASLLPARHWLAWAGRRAVAVEKTLVTAEELLAMPDDGGRRELIDGEVRTMAPAGDEHGDLEAVISGHLFVHLRAHPVGRLKTGETGFRLRRDPDRVRAPDVAVVLYARRPRETIGAGYLEGAPDLAVEVVSPWDTAGDVA